MKDTIFFTLNDMNGTDNERFIKYDIFRTLYHDETLSYKHMLR